MIFQSFIRPGCGTVGGGGGGGGWKGKETAKPSRVKYGPILYSAVGEGVLGNWNPGITGLANARGRGGRKRKWERAGEYSRELQPSRGSPSNEKRRRPGRDPKPKPTRFRSVEFISPPPASREAMEKSELDVPPLGRKFRFAKVFPTGRGRGCVLPSKFNVVPRVCFIIQEAVTQFEQPRESKFVGQLSSTSRGMWKREFP